MGTLDQTLPPGYHRLKTDGDNSLEGGKHAESRLALEEALEQLEAYYRAERELIEARLDRARRGLVEDFLAAADEAREAGDAARAAAAFDDALEAAPDATERDRILLLRQEGSADDDSRDVPLSLHLKGLYERTLAAPEDPAAHYNFAIELALDGYLDAAAAQLEQAVELSEDAPETQAVALFRLGNVYHDLERSADAIGAYEDALEKGYDKADVRYRIGAVCDWESDHDRARAEYEACLAANPEHVGALGAMGHSLESAGDMTGALGYYRRLEAVDPEDEETQLKLGDLNRHLGDAAAAAAAYRRAIELDPDGEFGTDAQAALEELEA